MSRKTISADLTQKEVHLLDILAHHFEGEKPKGMHASTSYIGKILREHLKANSELVRNLRKERVKMARERLRTKQFFGFKK